MPLPIQEVDVQTVSKQLEDHSGVILLDVREPWEYDVAHLPGAMLIPLGTLPESLSLLNRDQPYVVYCHHGSRSALAVGWLQQQGFTQVMNLRGGIAQWSASIDDSVAQY